MSDSNGGGLPWGHQHTRAANRGQWGAPRAVSTGYPKSLSVAVLLWFCCSSARSLALFWWKRVVLPRAALGVFLSGITRLRDAIARRYCAIARRSEFNDEQQPAPKAGEIPPNGGSRHAIYSYRAQAKRPSDSSTSEVQRWLNGSQAPYGHEPRRQQYPHRMQSAISFL